jgi:uncharacterized protein YkwD
MSHAKQIAASFACTALFALLAACGSSSDSNSNAGTSAGTAAPGSNAAVPRSVDSTPTSALTSQAVTQINAIRASARYCGGISFAATSALAGSAKLESAAVQHVQHMKSTDTLSHTGSANSSIGQRVSDAGYVWSTVGENIASGYETLADVLQGWVESPGHCANLMSPNFSDVGIAQSAGGADSYWALTLAKPGN